MKSFKEIIYNLFLNKFMFKKQFIPLGRWNIEYCNKKINRKIDLSNVDHCGPCGINSKNK